MITKEQIIDIIKDNTENYRRVNLEDAANEILNLLQADVIKSVCNHKLPDIPCPLVKCRVCGDFMDIKEQTVL